MIPGSSQIIDLDVLSPDESRELTAELRRSQAYLQMRRGRGRVERLPVAAAAWVLGSLAEDSGRPCLVVVPHEAQALRFVQGARLVLPLVYRFYVVHGGHDQHLSDGHRLALGGVPVNG